MYETEQWGNGLTDKLEEIDRVHYIRMCSLYLGCHAFNNHCEVIHAAVYITTIILKLQGV